MKTMKDMYTPCSNDVYCNENKNISSAMFVDFYKDNCVPIADYNSAVMPQFDGKM